MRVFKFGGASTKDADSIKNVADIISRFKNEELLIVISAIGKTTNALEVIADNIFQKNIDLAIANIDALEHKHRNIVEDLFSDKHHVIFHELKRLFDQLYDLQRYYCLEKVTIAAGYDYLYDQIVSMGELFSSLIVSHYLQSLGNATYWLDVRTVLKTDHRYRAGNVDWEVTKQLTQQKVLPLLTKQLVCTQGFIGGTIDNHTTTLGREGSDYTAAIMAYCLNAEEVVIWKDVPGVLNADPKWYPEAKLLNKISYNEAVELAYYGATVIHPKTIKPLQNKHIKLRVKSFIHPENTGTEIGVSTEQDKKLPSFIFKSNQVLLVIATKDFSFIDENDLSRIFSLLAQLYFQVNMMQLSAMHFSICLQHDSSKLQALLENLGKYYDIQLEEDLRLVTIRHYTQPIIDEVINGHMVLLSQESESTARYVVRAQQS
ncbi:MAG: aspartate kinase [Chitinophagales bacterium]|nr:aspartate kinase [Chitinophagales bacterium]